MCGTCLYTIFGYSDDASPGGAANGKLLDGEYSRSTFIDNRVDTEDRYRVR